MRVIEHRRHSMRNKPGQHLSQAGVDLARSVGADLGRFDLVVTSTLPRAFETAIAMGFAVDEQLEELCSLPDGFEAVVQWDEGFARFSEVMKSNPHGVVAMFGQKLAQLHREIAARLPDHGRALVISHGGIVEASVVGCMPSESFSSWGRACDYCEGVRMFFNGTDCERAELMRVLGRGSVST